MIFSRRIRQLTIQIRSPWRSDVKVVWSWCTGDPDKDFVGARGSDAIAKTSRSQIRIWCGDCDGAEMHGCDVKISGGCHCTGELR